MTSENGFNPNVVLTNSTFTIPIEITDTDEGGNPVKRTITVTYQYDTDTQDLFRKGLEDERAIQLESPGIPKTSPVTRDYRPFEQLNTMVKKIKGVETLDLGFWRRMPPRHQQAILEGVMSDIFPDWKTSGA